MGWMTSLLSIFAIAGLNAYVLEYKEQQPSVLNGLVDNEKENSAKKQLSNDKHQMTKPDDAETWMIETNEDSRLDIQHPNKPVVIIEANNEHSLDAQNNNASFPVLHRTRRSKQSKKSKRSGKKRHSKGKRGKRRNSREYQVVAAEDDADGSLVDPDRDGFHDGTEWSQRGRAKSNKKHGKSGKKQKKSKKGKSGKKSKKSKKRKSGKTKKGKGKSKKVSKEIHHSSERDDVCEIPFSGQLVRLRDGKTLHEGRIEVWRDGGWVGVCDDDWTSRNSHMVCRELGFSRGAVADLRGSGLGEDIDMELVLDEVTCSGYETSLQDCHFSSGPPPRCTADDMLSVVCWPIVGDGCDEGWVSLNGQCYRYVSEPTIQGLAAHKCSHQGGRLLSIESQEENDAVSQYLMQTTDEKSVWTAGWRYDYLGLSFWRWSGGSYITHFTNWFPGWQGCSDGSFSHQPSNSATENCIALSSHFENPEEEMQPAEYFFWDDETCSERLPFICEKAEHVENEDCYYGVGLTYTGDIDRTESGVICQKWTDSSIINPNTHPNWNLGAHNKCRNPDADRRPWCWVDVVNNLHDFCAILPCIPPAITTTTTELMPDVSSSCPDDTSYKCFKSTPQVCIGADWQCDGDEDCDEGEDEEQCEDVPENLPRRDICDPGYFQCISLINICIPERWKCDGEVDCLHGEDEEGCATVSPFALRLSGGRGEYEGRVEVRYHGVWGTVCDDRWDLPDANVVCNQLSFQGAIKATTMGTFGSGEHDFLLDEVSCYGSEATLEHCGHSPWGEHNCHRYETAGVICKIGKVCREIDQFQCRENGLCIPHTFVCDGEDDCGDGSDEQDCAVYSLELVGGSSDNEGRVEVTRNGVRGSICDDDWDDNDAAVVCRMLGLDGPAMAVGGGVFGAGSGVIWLDDVDCRGWEDNVANCRRAGRWGDNNCGHQEDAGVRCQRSDPLPTIRPAGQHTTREALPATAASCGRRPITLIESEEEEDSSPQLARIVGGSRAQYGAFPWQAAIQQHIEDSSFPFSWLFFGRGGDTATYGHLCGATIISEHWLLSAAHCFYNLPKEKVRVRIGDFEKNRHDTHEQTFLVEEIIMHPRYNNSNYDYDFALLKIRDTPNKNAVKNEMSGMQFNDYIQPACLPTTSMVYTSGLHCYVSGWGSVGKLITGHTYPSHLQHASIPLQQPSVCRRLYKGALTGRMLCAGYLQGGIDTCQGDSGGPLVCQTDDHGNYVVIGVTSWGNSCAQPNSPGVYANVSTVLDWINRWMDQ